MGDWYSLQPQGARREGREREGVRVGRRDVGGIGKAASFRRAWWAGLAGLADLTCRCEQEGVGWGSFSLSVCLPHSGVVSQIGFIKRDRPTALARSECESDFHWSPLPSPLESAVLQYIFTVPRECCFCGCRCNAMKQPAHYIQRYMIYHGRYIPCYNVHTCSIDKCHPVIQVGGR